MLINQNEIVKLVKWVYPKLFDYKDIVLSDIDIKIDNYIHLRANLNYYNIEKQANLLNVLEKKVEKEGAVSGYYYLSEPDYPVQRDWPKRLILLIVGFVFGVVLSSLIILAREVFSNKA